MFYHPYKDSNHCVYRMLSILFCGEPELSIERIKILDFYYLFPHFIRDIKPWPKGFHKAKKIFLNVSDPYEYTPNKKKLFFEMETIQNQALVQLASRGIISVEKLKEGRVVVDKSKIPLELTHQISFDDYNNSKLFQTIIEVFCDFQWKGTNGLKKRSGLMEYRYDE